jgi:TfoX/Sxy family transcriptional regulator of competence genes
MSRHGWRVGGLAGRRVDGSTGRRVDGSIRRWADETEEAFVSHKAASQQSELVERIRALLADEPSLREVSMFGGRSFMVNDKMVASARKDGDLLVRVASDQHAALASRPGAAQAQMGAGRDMGPGWIAVASASVADDEDLSFWLGAALEHNRG